jgi:glycosyltransferase involved in cell wall biosynthesis
MKILVINWQDIKNPLGGGAEVHLHEIFKRLAGRGHSVTLFCSSFRGALSEENIDGIHVLRQGGRNFFNFVVPVRYHSQFRRDRFEIVVDDINKIPFYTPLYVKEPLLAIVHHLFDRSIFAEASLPAASYVFGAERLALPIYRNTPMAVVSESTKQELVGHGFPDANIELVQNAVNHDLYRSLSQTESPNIIVGYLGRLKKYKSIDHLLSAFEIVKKEFPEAKLLIIGDGDARPALEKLANDLGLSQSVSFAGFVSAQEKVRLLNAMRVVVNTSAKEGWGLTVIEANACGVPVIASDVPGLRDSVVDEKTGFLYEYGNIEQLAQKILLVLRDDNLRKRLSRESIVWAQTFSWDSSADGMLRLLEKTVEGARSRHKHQDY